MGKEAYTLGLTSSHSPSVAAACVCFLELLGLSSLKLRVDMKVVNVILGYKCRNEDAHPSSVRESLGTAPLFVLPKGHWGRVETVLTPFLAQFILFISLS